MQLLFCSVNPRHWAPCMGPAKCGCSCFHACVLHSAPAGLVGSPVLPRLHALTAPRGRSVAAPACATALKRTWWWPGRWPWTAGPATQAAQFSQPALACMLFHVQVVAKALALECMRAAKAQERGCYVFAFAGPQEVRAGAPVFASPVRIQRQHKQGAPSFCPARDAGQGSTVLRQPG